MDKKIAVIVPAYNEELLIKTIDSMPEVVSEIIVINDCSTDNTKSIVKEEMKNNKINLINLGKFRSWFCDC